MPTATRVDRTFAERRALLGSIWASGVLALGAILLGVFSGSRVVVFDGAYMGIGIVLSVLSLRTATIAVSGPTARFPFGRDALTPLVVLVQGLAVTGTLLFAAGDAIVVIRQGGSFVNPIVIGVYGMITATAGFLVTSWLRRQAPDSDLVLAEISQWRAGAVLSTMMFFGAVAALILQAFGQEKTALYIDPVLVLLACLTVAIIPVRLIKAGLYELLEGAPSAEIDATVTDAVSRIARMFALPQPVIRCGKVGRKLYVEVDFLVSSTDWTIGDEDEVRRATISALEPLGLEIWAVVSLTADPGLTE